MLKRYLLVRRVWMCVLPILFRGSARPVEAVVRKIVPSAPALAAHIAAIHPARITAIHPVPVITTLAVPITAIHPACIITTLAVLIVITHIHTPVTLPSPSKSTPSTTES